MREHASAGWNSSPVGAEHAFQYAPGLHYPQLQQLTRCFEDIH